MHTSVSRLFFVCVVAILALAPLTASAQKDHEEASPQTAALKEPCQFSSIAFQDLDGVDAEALETFLTTVCHEGQNSYMQNAGAKDADQYADVDLAFKTYLATLSDNDVYTELVASLPRLDDWLAHAFRCGWNAASKH